MMPPRQLDIAVIGDKDLVNGLRLAGASKYHVVTEQGDAREDVRSALGNFLDDPDVGTVVMLEDYGEYARDLVARVRKGKHATPVIVEVPSKFGTTRGDPREYYKALVRESIGFDIEI